MHRCYCPDLPDTGIIALPPEEAHHAGSVLRLQVGDSLVLFDGAGREAQARVCSASKKTVEVEIESVAEVNRESKRKLTIAIALPKGDRQKWLIEKCVELGVAQILPLDVERSVAKAEKQVVQRLERQVIEASKQCRRNTLMKILDPMKWSEFLNILNKDGSEFISKDCLKLIAHPGGISVQDALTKVGESGSVLVRKADLQMKNALPPSIPGSNSCLWALEFSVSKPPQFLSPLRFVTDSTIKNRLLC